MDKYLRDYHVRRILADIIPFEYNGHIWYITTPLPEFKYYAEIIYKDVYEKSRSTNISSDDIIVILNRHGIWFEEDEKNLINFKKDLENTKVFLYENYLNEEKRYLFKNVINDVNSALENLNHKRNCMSHLTCEHISFSTKQRFLIGASILKPNKKRLWTKFSDWEKDNKIIDVAFEKISQNFLEEKDFRDLVKNDPWKTIWTISNKPQSIFKKSASELSDEQINMIVWSVVYDNISKSQDPPNKYVLEDDDALDGWMIKQKRKKENEEGIQEIKSTIGSNMNKYESLFILPQNESQIKKIYEMNDFAGKIAFKKRMMQINRDGIVNEANMMDRREQIITQANQLYAQGFRRKE